MILVPFQIITLVAIGLFYWATSQNKRVLFTAVGWLAIVGACAVADTFQTDPKRFIVVILTAFVLTTLCFYFTRLLSRYRI